LQASFDDERTVADSALFVTGTLIGRLDLERLTDGTISRGYRPGRNFFTVVSTLLAGGDCIDDVNLLHAGSTATIIGHDTVAASTVGSWLHSLTFGHIRELDAACETALRRAVSGQRFLLRISVRVLNQGATMGWRSRSVLDGDHEISPRGTAFRGR